MAAATGFSLDISKWIEKAGGNMDAVVRKIAFDIGARIIMRTPVDKGRARGNWVLGVGHPVINPDTSKCDRYRTKANPRGAGNSSAKADLLVGLDAYKPGKDQSIFITNSVPYIGRLEYGWSKQAPTGMVRVTLAEFGAVAQGAVRDAQNGRGGVND